MDLQLLVEKAGPASIHVVALHRPDGAVVRVFVDGKPLRVEEDKVEAALRSAHAARILNVHLKAENLAAGPHTLTVHCAEPGVVGLDYIWVRNESPER